MESLGWKILAVLFYAAVFGWFARRLGLTRERRTPSYSLGRPPVRWAVCPACIEENDPQVHVCSKCLAPIAPFATIDPILRAQSSAWAASAAAKRPTRLILVGTWLIYGPCPVSILLLPWMQWGLDPRDTDLVLLAGLMLGYGLVGCVFLFRVTQAFRRRGNGRKSTDPDVR